MHEVDIQLTDPGNELRESVEAIFLGSPVKTKSPAANQAFHECEAGSIVPALGIRTAWHASELEPSQQVVKLVFGNGNLERSYIHWIAFTSTAP